jgi:hypothetical protein
MVRAAAGSASSRDLKIPERKPGNDHDMQAGEIGMGSFVYGYVTAQRVVAPPGESQASAAPAMATHIDTLAALVPAEALALYAGVVVPNVTSAVPVTGKTGTVISDPALLGWSCAGLLVLSAGLYIVGRLKEKLTLSLWDIPRALIPLAAFTCWMLGPESRRL